MEKIQTQPNRAKNGAWLILLLSVIVAAATAWIPAGLLLAPAFWAYAGARGKPAWIALPALVYGALALMLYNTEAALGLFVSATAAAFALYYMQTRRISNAYTALTLAGLFLAGLYCAVCLPGILSGAGAFAGSQAAMDEMISFYRTAAAQISGISAEYLDFINTYLDAFSEAVPSFIVAALCAGAGVLGLGNLLFFRLFCRRRKEIAISPMREFRYWTMPRSMMLGLFALLIGSLVLEWTGWTFSDGMSSTVNVLVAMPLLLQGLCVIDFFLARARRSAATARVVSYVLIGLLFGLVQTPLILLGCLEQIVRIRERTQNMPPKPAL
ncbi:MAG: YybS family protein [Eubacteriales bacterium]|nr:YybS family protein [Eubacteriales bacterium]